MPWRAQRMGKARHSALNGPPPCSCPHASKLKVGGGQPHAVTYQEFGGAVARGQEGIP